jgi:hypothetical protein
MVERMDVLVLDGVGMSWRKKKKKGEMERGRRSISSLVGSCLPVESVEIYVRKPRWRRKLE